MKLAIALYVLAFSASIASAQTCLLNEGGDIPGAPGVTVGSLTGTAVNGVGGYAVAMTASDGTSRIWGSASGGTGSVLHALGTYATYDQDSLEGFFGLTDDGRAVYSANLTDSGGTSGIDSVWLGATPLALEGHVVPSLSGNTWRYASRPGALASDGFWFGGIDDQSGLNAGMGLFRTSAATPIYVTGQLIAGATAPLSTNAVDFDSRVSRSGLHHLCILDVDVASTQDAHLALDGQLLFLGGMLVSEGAPIPASVGGLAGENWDNFDFVGINDAGQYLFTGDTDGVAASDEIVVLNGQIILREGDIVDGRTLTGSIEGAALDEDGSYAVIWDVEDGQGGSQEALLVDGAIVLVAGDTVDVDGDGTLDSHATLTSFTGISTLTMGIDRAIYVTADIDVMGTASSADDSECLIELRAVSVEPCVALPDLSAPQSTPIFMESMTPIHWQADRVPWIGDVSPPNKIADTIDAGWCNSVSVICSTAA